MPPPAFHWPTVCGCGPLQRELFPRPGFSITPEAGRKEPRLWVRRVMIWRDHEHVTRDIRLRPGLNIIWSPDAGTSETAPIGHGGGKTTFCRLLRYCLGEDSFAPDGQRQRVWSAFPEGKEGAELVIDGPNWSSEERRVGEEWVGT